MTETTGVLGEKPVKQGPFFYGWWIVAGSFLIMATCYTIFVNCIPLFQSHVVKDLGISVAAFNTGVSLCTVVAIFASLAFGALVEKVDARILGGFTVVTTSVTLLLFSFITEVWQLYALCIVAGMVVVAGTRLLASVFTTNWFNLRRGLAVSIALSGSGLGGVILSPITSNMIEASGWRPAFLLLAVISFVAALPIAVFFFRNRPSDKGLEPYGAGISEAQKVDRSPDKPVTVSVGWMVLRRSSGFWVLIVGFVMMGIINGAIITNSVSNMTTMTVDGTSVVTGGHDVLWAGYVWSLYLGVVIVAKIALGAIYDRWGMAVGTVIGTVACIIASIALCFPATDAGPIIAAIAFGFGTCMGTVTPPVMTAKAYGKKDIGLIIGIVTAFELFGAAIGAVVSGLLFDAFLTFFPAWIMTLVASILMGLTLVLSIPAARKIVKRRIEAGGPELDVEGNDVTT
ncbi:MAG TPA: MFS transporter [Coriobacteriia bacterium]|nr:MFS transporter [Coriobacteriia bacterium]